MEPMWKQPNSCGECPCYVPTKESYYGFCDLMPDRPYRESSRLPCKLIHYLSLILRRTETHNA